MLVPIAVTLLVCAAVYALLLAADRDGREQLGCASSALSAVLGVAAIGVALWTEEPWRNEIPRWVVAIAGVVSLSSVYFSMLVVSKLSALEREARDRTPSVGAPSNVAAVVPRGVSCTAALGLIGWFAMFVPWCHEEFPTEHGACGICGREFEGDATAALGGVTGMAWRLPYEATADYGYAPETETSNVHQLCFDGVRGQSKSMDGMHGMLGGPITRPAVPIRSNLVSLWALWRRECVRAKLRDRTHYLD
ncbi:MAG: hypothetical protein IT454_13730 [Planctomycetes bacterium]|nr:hypothetical protein [Planctomycetota bacterium]